MDIGYMRERTTSGLRRSNRHPVVRCLVGKRLIRTEQESDAGATAQFR